jgi:hypothetical protein
LDDDAPPDLADLVALALSRIRVFLEVDAHAMMATPAEPVPGVRFVPLSASDPLSNEWSVAVVGPHFYALLAARDSGPTQEPFRYGHMLTHDRDLVLRGARALLSRVS